LRHGQQAQTDPRRRDPRETGIIAEQRVDIAMHHGAPGAFARADRHPAHLFVGIDAEPAQHRASDRIIRRIKAADPDPLAFELADCRERAVRPHHHVPAEGIGLFEEIHRHRRLALCRLCNLDERHAHGEFDLPARPARAGCRRNERRAGRNQPLASICLHRSGTSHTAR
jgi:hypothetical protein